MSDQRDRLGPPRSLNLFVLAQYVVHARGNVFRLFREGSAVQSRELFVEVDREVVKVHLVIAVLNGLPERDRGEGADLIRIRVLMLEEVKET